MLEIENKKIELKIFKLKLEIEERQTKLKKLEEKLESNNKVIESIEDDPMGDYKNIILRLNKNDAELFKSIWKLDPSERLGWKPDGKFKCNMCLQYFNEGFNSYEDHLRFFYRHPYLKHLSTYCIKHHTGSICEQNRYCSYCDDKNLKYGRDNMFMSRTERVRHLKKHKKEGICVPCNVATKDKSEVIEEIKKYYSKMGKRTIPKNPEERKKELKENIIEPESDDSSSTQPESILDRMGNADPTKIQKPRISLKEKLALKKEEEKAKEKQQEKEDKQRRIKLWADANEGNKKLGLPLLPEPIFSEEAEASEYDWSDTEVESEGTYTDITTEAEEEAPTENHYHHSFLATRPTYLT